MIRRQMSANPLPRAPRALLLIAALLGSATWVSSQTPTTGRITGTVRDPQGAVISGAMVAIENDATADHYSVATDDSGSYSAPQLLPALYDVTVQATGFTTAEFRGIVVGPTETVTLNTTLQLAQGNVSITISYS